MIKLKLLHKQPLVKTKLRKNKKGAIGESVLMMYRIFLVLIIAFFILGVGAFTYSYYIDIRDAEAILFARDVAKCISPDGIINVNTFPADDGKFLENYCKFKGAERFYAKVVVKSENIEKNLSEGNNNLAWTEGIYQNEELTEGIRKYKPGILHPINFPVIVNGKGGTMQISVIVNPEI